MDAPLPRIDVIDLALPDEEVAKALRRACEEVGFFYLINHGIDPVLVENVFKEGKAFFELSSKEKEALNMNPAGRGYTAYMVEKLEPEIQTCGDTKEGFYIGKDVPADDPQAGETFKGCNVWPAPELLPGWREVMMTYWTEARVLCMRMLPLLAMALELPPDWFSKPHQFDDPMSLLRLLHYPAVKSLPEEGVFGCGAHSDWGVLTLLAIEGETGGLQICREKDENPRVWEDVPPIPGAFVVNLGDCIERWTNNKFRSTLHRVINPGIERYSIPFFFEPDFDCVVECLPSCCSPDNPPKYEPITAGDYLIGKYAETHEGFSEHTSQPIEAV
eukprot:TRINITY_DN4722_c0_g1_i1.p1 TRINITY_DN4722_c0_g1~~TRINITY_DN4722_c0_g1_i1.p1  ORF type:complete len:331 (+),score=62.03 TRINITY_DN4722_c0_g1_i1:415-1407(+)